MRLFATNNFKFKGAFMSELIKKEFSKLTQLITHLKQEVCMHEWSTNTPNTNRNFENAPIPLYGDGCSLLPDGRVNCFYLFLL